MCSTGLESRQIGSGRPTCLFRGLLVAEPPTHATEFCTPPDNGARLPTSGHNGPYASYGAGVEPGTPKAPLHAAAGRVAPFTGPARGAVQRPHHATLGARPSHVPLNVSVPHDGAPLGTGRTCHGGLPAAPTARHGSTVPRDGPRVPVPPWTSGKGRTACGTTSAGAGTGGNSKDRPGREPHGDSYGPDSTYDQER